MREKGTNLRALLLALCTTAHRHLPWLFVVCSKCRGAGARSREGNWSSRGSVTEVRNLQPAAPGPLLLKAADPWAKGTYGLTKYSTCYVLSFKGISGIERED